MYRYEQDPQGTLDYSEFVTAALAKRRLTREELKGAFDQLDEENKGRLTQDGIRTAFRRRG